MLKINYKWTIKKYYDDNVVITSKEGFETYNQCLEDVLRHTTINNAFRSAYEKEILTLNIKIEEVDNDENN